MKTYDVSFVESIILLKRKELTDQNNIRVAQAYCEDYIKVMQLRKFALIIAWIMI